MTDSAPTPADDPTLAFEAMMLPHLPDVARYARSLTRDRTAADDLVQETYEFNENACMALKKTIDRNLQTTTFEYADEAPRLVMESGQQYYDDPTKEIDAKGYSKVFTYHANTRILKSVTDARGVKTEYEMDQGQTPSAAPFGRRTKETVGGLKLLGGKV